MKASKSNATRNTKSFRAGQRAQYIVVSIPCTVGRGVKRAASAVRNATSDFARGLMYKPNPVVEESSAKKPSAKKPRASNKARGATKAPIGDKK